MMKFLIRLYRKQKVNFLARKILLEMVGNIKFFEEHEKAQRRYNTFTHLSRMIANQMVVMEANEDPMEVNYLR